MEFERVYRQAQLDPEEVLIEKGLSIQERKFGLLC